MITNEERREIAEVMRDDSRFSVSSCGVAWRLGLYCGDKTCKECGKEIANWLADFIESTITPVANNETKKEPHKPTIEAPTDKEIQRKKRKEPVEFLPCPDCYSRVYPKFERTNFYGDADKYKTQVWVVCCECGWETNRHNTILECAKEWNTVDLEQEQL